jgi:hypothetical protein
MAADVFALARPGRVWEATGVEGRVGTMSNESVCDRDAGPLSGCEDGGGLGAADAELFV